MGLESFSQQLKRGLDDRDPDLNNELQSAAIREPVLSGLCVALLAPALVEVAIGFAPRPPGINAEDLQQQIVLQTLDSARTIPIEGEHFVKRWLVLEVSRRIGRWLTREASRTGALALDQEASVLADEEAEAWEMTEVLASRPRHDDLELLYRLDVLGEIFEEVARDLGCTANAVECWRRRARARLQRHLAP